MERFEHLQNEYFQTDKPHTIGLPSVAYCVSELNLSYNCFGELIKKEPGKTNQEYIQAKVIDVAKEKIFDQGKSVNQIAFELGFKYTQHFSRLFKRRIGIHRMNTITELKSNSFILLYLALILKKKFTKKNLTFRGNPFAIS